MPGMGQPCQRVRCRKEELFLTWHLVSREVEGHVGEDSDEVVVGAVQLHPEVPGHHVSTGGKARALREGSCTGDQAQRGAGPACNGTVGSPSILHPAAGNNVELTSNSGFPNGAIGLSDLQSHPPHWL